MIADVTDRVILCCILLTFAATIPASAQQTSSGGGLNGRALYGYLGGGGTHAESAGGAALTAGVVGRVGALLVTFTPLDSILYPANSTGFLGDPILDTHVRCGDSSGFSFVETNQCVNATYGYSFDLAVLVPRTPLFTGAGARFERDHNQWFGAAGYAWFSRDSRTMLAIKGMFGEDLVSGVVSVGFRIAGH
jgi:hypothetical protein